jgi:hypothetical protein
VSRPPLDWWPGRRRPVVPHHPPPPGAWPADYPTRPAGTVLPARPMVVREAATARRWRRMAQWGIPAAFVLGMLAGVLLSVGSAERPTGRLTLANPGPSATASPVPPVQSVRRLPGGTVVATLTDGRVVPLRDVPGRVIVNGTPQPDIGPTTVRNPAGGTLLYWRTCAQARAAGAAPLSDDDIGYRPGLDPDGDGMACE